MKKLFLLTLLISLGFSQWVGKWSRDKVVFMMDSSYFNNSFYVTDEAGDTTWVRNDGVLTDSVFIEGIFKRSPVEFETLKVVTFRKTGFPSWNIPIVVMDKNVDSGVESWIATFNPGGTVNIASNLASYGSQIDIVSSGSNTPKLKFKGTAEFIYDHNIGKFKFNKPLHMDRTLVLDTVTTGTTCPSPALSLVGNYYFGNYDSEARLQVTHYGAVPRLTISVDTTASKGLHVVLNIEHDKIAPDEDVYVSIGDPSHKFIESWIDSMFGKYVKTNFMEIDSISPYAGSALKIFNYGVGENCYIDLDVGTDQTAGLIFKEQTATRWALWCNTTTDSLQIYCWGTSRAPISLAYDGGVFFTDKSYFRDSVFFATGIEGKHGVFDSLTISMMVADSVFGELDTTGTWLQTYVGNHAIDPAVVRDTIDVYWGDSSAVLRAEMIDSALVVWNDSAGLMLRHDGSVALSADWAAGDFDITGVENVESDTATPGVLNTQKITTGAIQGTMDATEATVWNFPSIDIANGESIKRGYFVVSKAFDYDDGDITIIQAQDGWIVVDVWVEVTTQWVGTGYTITVGDAGNADGFIEHADVTWGTTGWYCYETNVRGIYLHDGLSNVDQKVYSGATDLKVYNNAGLTSDGVATVYLGIISVK